MNLQPQEWLCPNANDVHYAPAGAGSLTVGGAGGHALCLVLLVELARALTVQSGHICCKPNLFRLIGQYTTRFKPAVNHRVLIPRRRAWPWLIASANFPAGAGWTGPDVPFAIPALRAGLRDDRHTGTFCRPVQTFLRVARQRFRHVPLIRSTGGCDQRYWCLVFLSVRLSARAQCLYGAGARA